MIPPQISSYQFVPSRSLATALFAVWSAIALLVTGLFSAPPMYGHPGLAYDSPEAKSRLATFIYDQGFVDSKRCAVTTAHQVSISTLTILPEPNASQQGGLSLIAKFTGKERDAETGLDYFEARYLSSAQGRFTSTDPKSGWPSDPQSWNMYAYGRNNPLLYTDPDGQTYRICQVGNDGKETNCTEQKNELTDRQFNQFQKDSKGKMTFSGGKIFAVNDDGSRTQTGTYKQTDVDLNDAGQELFQGNRQLWHNSATVVNAAAVGTGALMALPAAAEIAALPSLQVAVGQSFNQWHVAFRATGGPWLHGMGLGAESGVTVTEAGAARFAGKALFNFSVKILRPGPVNAMGAGGGAAAGSCLRAACTAFLKGWGLK